MLLKVCVMEYTQIKDSSVPINFSGSHTYYSLSELQESKYFLRLDAFMAAKNDEYSWGTSYITSKLKSDV
jgi:hypothetical protein